MSEQKTLLDCVYHWEQNQPNRVCMTQPLGGGDENLLHLTFAQMMDVSRRMAAYLRGLSLPPKSQIGICSKNCAYWAMADLAIWMSGHVTVPIYPTLTANSLRYILEHSETKLLFIGKLDPLWQQMKDGVPNGLPQVDFPLAPPSDHPQWDDLVASHPPISDPAERDPQDMATIIYTSGSMGRPKGVMHDFATMLACTRGLSEFVSATPGDRYLSYLPLAHGMERWAGECLLFYTGHHVFYAETLDTFLDDMRRAKPTLFLSVPRLWGKFQAGVYQKLPPEKYARLMKIPLLRTLVKKKVLKQLGLDNTRIAASGSAPIPKELISWYQDLGLELLEGYGMTENFNYSHLSQPGRSRPGYVGPPQIDTLCRIADSGEIEVNGPGSMMGYYKMPEETKKAFTEDGYLRTGDLGEIDEKNRLRITGRVKEIFKTTKGKYVAPAPIENLLASHPLIELTCVTGSGFPQPFAIVQLSDEAHDRAIGGERETLRQDLEEHLRKINADLPPHEKLAFITVIGSAWSPENGYLTPTMKIRRAKIEHNYTARAPEWYDLKEPVIFDQQ